MSKISIKPITCPKCKHSGEFKMYESVNASLDSKQRGEVLSGHIFEWVCPQCGETRQFIEGQLQERLILFDKVNYDNYLQELKTDDRFKMSLYCDTINEKWLMERLK